MSQTSVLPNAFSSKRNEDNDKEEDAGVLDSFPVHRYCKRQQTFSIMSTTNGALMNRLAEMCWADVFFSLSWSPRLTDTCRNFNVSLKPRGRPLPTKQKWHCQPEDGQATSSKELHDEKMLLFHDQEHQASFCCTGF